MDETEALAHIVYCRNGVFLDKRQYSNWRDIQDAYEDYMASLGPWSEAEILEFFAEDFSPDEATWPFRRQAIEEFFRSEVQVLENLDD